MNNPSGKDLWFYRNQPYGFWKAGNPYVKISVVMILLTSTFIANAPLMIQASLLTMFLIYAPSYQKTRIFNIFINFGLSCFLISISGKWVRSNINVRALDIPNVAKIDMVILLSLLCVFFSFISIGKAITSRDVAWFIDIFGKKGRERIGSGAFAFIYALVRWPAIISQTKKNIKIRGGCPILIWPRCRKNSDFVDRIGLLAYNCLSFMNEMTTNIQYIINSRIRLIERDNPSKRAFSETDWSILGSLVFTVILSLWI